MAIPFYVNDDDRSSSRGRRRNGHSPEQQGQQATSNHAAGSVAVPPPREHQRRMQIQVVVATATTTKPIPSSTATAVLDTTGTGTLQRSNNTLTFTTTCDKSFVLDGLVLSLIGNNDNDRTRTGGQQQEVDTEHIGRRSSSLPIALHSTNSNSSTNQAAVADIVVRQTDNSFRDIGIALREIADSYQYEHRHEQHQQQHPQVEQKIKNGLDQRPRTHQHQRQRKSKWWTQYGQNQVLKSAIAVVFGISVGGLLGVAVAVSR